MVWLVIWSPQVNFGYGAAKYVLAYVCLMPDSCIKNKFIYPRHVSNYIYIYMFTVKLYPIKGDIYTWYIHTSANACPWHFLMHNNLAEKIRQYCNMILLYSFGLEQWQMLKTETVTIPMWKYAKTFYPVPLGNFQYIMVANVR